MIKKRVFDLTQDPDPASYDDEPLPPGPPRVFCVENPHEMRGGKWVPARDLSDTARFGPVTFLLAPTGIEHPVYRDETIAELRRGLEDFSENDYLVAGIGHPLCLAWATVIAACCSGGKLRLLYWQRNHRRYAPITVDLSDIVQGDFA